MNTWFLCWSMLCLLWERGFCEVTSAPLKSSCGVVGYDTSSLLSARYWSIPLTKNSDWLLPGNVTVDEVRSVTVFISICKTLPTYLCGGNAQSSICQNVTLQNSTSIAFDMGSYSESNAFQPLKTNSDGFYVERHGENPVDTHTCNQTLKTFLSFQCDSSARWSHQTHDIAGFVIEATTNDSPCAYIINLRYDGACYNAPTASPDTCQLSSYDTSTLAAQPYWYADVHHTACYNGTEDEECSFIFSFCHALPKEDGSRFNLNNCYKQQASVCQIGQTASAKQSEYNMGTFENYTRFSKNVNAGNDGFHISFQNGSTPEEGSVCSEGFLSRLILICNKNAEWPDNGNVGEFTQVFYQPGDDPCMFVIELQYSGACSSDTPTNNVVFSAVGWIFIGLFGGILVVYLLIGTSIKYFVKGARGAEVIPNYQFWAFIVGLVGEGCIYSWNLVTCRRFKRNLQQSSGVEYDKI